MPFGSPFLKGFFLFFHCRISVALCPIFFAFCDNNAPLAIILFSEFEIVVANRATCDANLDFLISCFAFTL